MKERFIVQSRLIICAILAMALLAACSLAPMNNAANPEPTATETPTITPTIVWFPPTPTLAPQPTATSTPEQDLKPGVGELFFKDDFQNSDHWTRESTARGNIIPGDGKLTLSVMASKGELTAIRLDTQVDNFYAEANIKVNLCQGDDMAGMIFRTAGTNSYYRYLVDCNGRVTAQVVYSGAPTAMQDWTPSGELISGLPLPFKLGVWASKNVMRFFINDQYQFEIDRSAFLNGGIGFYARAGEEPSLSVSIDDLAVYKVLPSTAQTLTPQVPSPTVTPAH